MLLGEYIGLETVWREAAGECSQGGLQSSLLPLVCTEVAGRTIGFETLLKLERKWLPEIIVATVRTWRDY